MVTGAAPQAKVMVPPPASARRSAPSLQLAPRAVADRLARRQSLRHLRPRAGRGGRREVAERRKLPRMLLAPGAPGLAPCPLTVDHLEAVRQATRVVALADPDQGVVGAARLDHGQAVPIQSLRGHDDVVVEVDPQVRAERAAGEQAPPAPDASSVVDPDQAVPHRQRAAGVSGVELHHACARVEEAVVDDEIASMVGDQACARRVGDQDVGQSQVDGIRIRPGCRPACSDLQRMDFGTGGAIARPDGDPRWSARGRVADADDLAADPAVVRPGERDRVARSGGGAARPARPPLDPARIRHDVVVAGERRRTGTASHVVADEGSVRLLQAALDRRRGERRAGEGGRDQEARSCREKASKRHRVLPPKSTRGRP